MCFASPTHVQGLQDKRACTSQQITAFKFDARKLIGQNNYIKWGMLGDFEYCRSGLRLGDLKGNRFQIILRDVDQPNDILKQACEELKARGFINYYGRQVIWLPRTFFGFAELLDLWIVVSFDWIV